MGRIGKAAWDAYYEVNLIFAEVNAPQRHEGDSTSIHDYHLKLLPQFLRETTQLSGLEVKIGFFLHTPFPSSAVYSILLMGETILAGLLHCDLVGFHTVSYARHFLTISSGNSPETQAMFSTTRYRGAKLIVRVDRLDYIKDVPQKLHALETFLNRYPEWVRKVVLMQVAVPTRQDVGEYQSLQAEVNELVGRLNANHG
ncbi:trehalose-6-P synthase/phosphatase complex synthase subunit [Penicillium chrysogenum]|nr:trehalose-6-P synthase/phosphatase complex synthase subunit [Penicillium chrysogenum]